MARIVPSERYRDQLDELIAGASNKRLFQHNDFLSIATAVAAARSLDETFIEKDYDITEILQTALRGALYWPLSCARPASISMTSRRIASPVWPARRAAPRRRSSVRRSPATGPRPGGIGTSPSPAISRASIPMLGRSRRSPRTS